MRKARAHISPLFRQIDDTLFVETFTALQHNFLVRVSQHCTLITADFAEVSLLP